MGKTASVILLRALEDQDATGPLKDVMLRHNGWGIFIGAVNGSILNVWRTQKETNVTGVNLLIILNALTSCLSGHSDCFLREMMLIWDK